MSDIIKKEKIDKFGEVFTPFHLVQDMLDMISKEQWGDPTQVFFEPSCGDGNFIEQIIRKRIDALNIQNIDERIETILKTLCGVEIQKDNYEKTKERIKTTIKEFTNKTFEDLIDKAIHNEDFFVFMEKYKQNKKEKEIKELFDD